MCGRAGTQEPEVGLIDVDDSVTTFLDMGDGAGQSSERSSDFCGRAWSTSRVRSARTAGHVQLVT